MKRSGPLKRSTPLKRGKPMKKKRRRGDKPEVRMKHKANNDRCAVTWARRGQFGVELDEHHLVGGAGRKDDPRNLLTISREVHNHYHFGGIIGTDCKQKSPLTPGMLMWVKREMEPELYDEAYIAELLGRKALPDNWLPVEPPAWVFEERERNQR